mgnify:CR=1 FL=1|jgi:hypothetical protein|nr:MAG TPA: hypothetical protein [Caudoviricetes sp.]
MILFARKIIELLYFKGVIDKKEYNHIIDTIQERFPIETTIEAIDDVIKESKGEKNAKFKESCSCSY